MKRQLFILVFVSTALFAMENSKQNSLEFSIEKSNDNNSTPIKRQENQLIHFLFQSNDLKLTLDGDTFYKEIIGSDDKFFVQVFTWETDKQNEFLKSNNFEQPFSFNISKSSFSVKGENKYNAIKFYISNKLSRIIGIPDSDRFNVLYKEVEKETENINEELPEEKQLTYRSLFQRIPRKNISFGVDDGRWFLVDLRDFDQFNKVFTDDENFKKNLFDKLNKLGDSIPVPGISKTLNHDEWLSLLKECENPTETPQPEEFLRQLQQ